MWVLPHMVALLTPNLPILNRNSIMNNLSFWVSGCAIVTKVVPNHPASSGWDQSYSWKLQTCSWLAPRDRLCLSEGKGSGSSEPHCLPPLSPPHHTVTPPWAEWPEEGGLAEFLHSFLATEQKQQLYHQVLRSSRLFYCYRTFCVLTTCLRENGTFNSCFSCQDSSLLRLREGKMAQSI